MKLNENQKKAVFSKDENIFLLAGAGSGKTRVIIERINYLLNHTKPEDILCITFTVKSSLEMKKRLLNDSVDIYTFHGYCHNILSQTKDINIYKEDGVFSSHELLAFSNYKNSLFQINKPIKYDKYINHLNQNDLYDFDDLIINSLKVEHKKYKYIFIDEFQDTNVLQYELIKKMNHSNLVIFAVGDPDQSIYRFRGAKVDLIEKYIKDFNANLIKLEQNYRSKNEILVTANNLITHNLNRFKKTLITTNKEKGLLKLYIDSTDQNIKKIISLLKSRNFKDVAILYRNHYQVNKLKQFLERYYIFNVSYYSFHESKGLEFETVIIFGAEILPFNKENTYSQTEEERRLLFVAITRAKTNLIIFSTSKTKFIKELKLPNEI